MVEYTVDVVQPSGSDEGAVVVAAVAVAVAVTGQTVVPMTMVSVVTWPTLPGQSVTVAAQLVMVYVVVE